MLCCCALWISTNWSDIHWFHFHWLSSMKIIIWVFCTICVLIEQLLFMIKKHSTNTTSKALYSTDIEHCETFSYLTGWNPLLVVTVLDKRKLTMNSEWISQKITWKHIWWLEKNILPSFWILLDCLLHVTKVLVGQMCLLLSHSYILFFCYNNCTFICVGIWLSVF